MSLRKPFTRAGRPESPAEPTESLTDEDLAGLARDGSVLATETLFQRYRPSIRATSRQYFLLGAEHEDVMQEAMIGLFEAIRDYDRNRGCSFKTFAELCMSRQVIAAVRSATRHKHSPLNDYVSLKLTGPLDDDPLCLSAERLNKGDSGDPLEILLSSHDFSSLVSRLGETLSSLERDVLFKYLEGRTYQEIAARLELQIKSIDNALQRIRRKIQSILISRREELAASLN